MKKILKCLLFVMLFLVITLLLIPLGNNIILSKYTNELKSSNLNGTYEIIESDEECGKLIGNGNGMQYFSALLIKSDENLQWDNGDLEGVFLIRVGDSSFDHLINGFDFGDYFVDIKQKLKDSNNKDINMKDYYVLYSFYNAPIYSIWNNDIRAH